MDGSSTWATSTFASASGPLPTSSTRAPIALPFLVEPNRVTTPRRGAAVPVHSNPQRPRPGAAQRRGASAGRRGGAGRKRRGALLNYVPFADNDAVVDEVHDALTVLSVRAAARWGPLSRPCATSSRPAALPRRSCSDASAWPRTSSRPRRAMKDTSPLVRLRPRGTAGRPGAGARALIEQIPSLSRDDAQRRRRDLADAGDRQGPAGITLSADTPAARAKAARRLEGVVGAAIAEQADRLALRRGEQYQGLVTVCEYDGGLPGRGTGKVWQRGRDGRVRWEQEGFVGAMYAQALPNGRVLVVAENMAQPRHRAQRRGEVVWEYRTTDQPRRLPALAERQHLHRHLQPGDGSHARQERRLLLQPRPGILPLSAPSGRATAGSSA